MMLKKTASLILSVIMLAYSAIASAEGIVAFEALEYDTIPQKSVTLKPVAQGIEGKIKYEWDSSDPEIAKVTQKGKVTGVSVGEATITCTATTSNDEVYMAECKIIVRQPMNKITPVAKKIELPAHHFFKAGELFTFEPADISEVGFTVTVSNTGVVHMLEDGSFLTFLSGKAKMTIKAEDGSGKKASIEITVPPVYVREDEIVLEEGEPYILLYQENVGGSFGEVKGDAIVYTHEDIEDVQELVEGDPLAEYYDVEALKITPVKAGKAEIVFRENGRKKTIKVEVLSAAVVDEVSYPPINYDKMKAGEKVSASGVVFATEEVPGDNSMEYMAYLKDGDNYLCFVGAEPVSYLEGNEYTGYGVLDSVEEYMTETGLRFNCPFIRVIQVDRK